MNVLLVATNRERSPYPVAPLGTLCVAAAARAAGHTVDFLDLGLASSPQKALRQALEKNGCQAVAFGIRNLDNCWAFAPKLYFDEVCELAETVRDCFQGPLILGGSGFSVSPHGWMTRLKATCGVIGEGERAFPEVLARLEAGRSLDGIGGVITLLDQYDILREKGPRSVSPHTVPMLMPNGPAANVGLELQARAGVHTPVSACASGAEAIGYAMEMIRNGRADVVVTGGVEAAIHALPIAGFASMKALSTRNDDPAKASRPYDSDRDGFVLGEGGGIIVIESLEHAQKRRRAAKAGNSYAG